MCKVWPGTKLRLPHEGEHVHEMPSTGEGECKAKHNVEMPPTGDERELKVLPEKDRHKPEVLPP